MSGTLFVVATPIGNLEDITQRALRTLREVDLIACEDTRHTRKLLNHFGIEKKTVSYHEHNETQRANQLREAIKAGQDVALVSDAGTPLISDPGFRVVNVAIENGLQVVVVPGVTALAAALAGSGLPSDQFFFGGFLPARATARRAILQDLNSFHATLIFYEAPHRIAATLRDAQAILGNRRAVVARELTKLHEEFLRGALAELVETFSDTNKARGEMVLMIEGATGRPDTNPEAASISTAFIARMAELQATGLDEKAAMKKAARELGLKRDEAYRLRLAQKNRLSR